ncbi:MAG TPA: DUF4340 domain-containing protein [Anaerolineae bacterium]|nr:DUF4340 domain-containing protein [Anaerolineae bacterium]
MKRHQQVLAAILIVQIILSAVLLWPRQTTGGTGQAIFPDLKVEDIVALTITDDQENAIKMQKEGDTWGLVEADAYPVREATLTTLLEKLPKLTNASLVAQTAASHKQLQVAEDDFVRRLEIAMRDGKTYTLYLGSAPRYTATHFRVDGQTETYMTAEMTTWEVNATVSSWIDTTYCQVDQAELTEVIIQNANGTFTLVKSGEEWQLADLTADETPSPGKTSGVVGRVSRIAMAHPLGKTAKPEYGLDAPLATITLKTADATYTMLIGAQTDDTSYAAKYSGSDYYAAVPSYSVKTLTENVRADFLETPVEPTAPPTAP